MTTITIERAVLLRALEALRPATAPNGAKRDAAFEELRAALAAPAAAPEKTVKEIMEFVRHYAANTFSSATLEDKIRRSLAAPATAPESGVMTEIDYNDDDALRFVQRVLESDAPLSDIRDARNMVVEIRTRVLKARASKPATAPEPICTKCGDVITAHDPGLCGCCLSTRDATSPERTICQTAYSVGSTRCLMLFNVADKRHGTVLRDGSA